MTIIFFQCLVIHSTYSVQNCNQLNLWSVFLTAVTSTDSVHNWAKYCCVHPMYCLWFQSSALTYGTPAAIFQSSFWYRITPIYFDSGKNFNSTPFRMGILVKGTNSEFLLGQHYDCVSQEKLSNSYKNCNFQQTKFYEILIYSRKKILNQRNFFQFGKNN